VRVLRSRQAIVIGRAGRRALLQLMPAAELLMFGSDHPHRHGSGGEALLELLDNAGREAIEFGNAAELYGLAQPVASFDAQSEP
jgi:hypothetical protein